MSNGKSIGRKPTKGQKLAAKAMKDLIAKKAIRKPMFILNPGDNFYNDGIFRNEADVCFKNVCVAERLENLMLYAILKFNAPRYLLTLWKTFIIRMWKDQKRVFSPQFSFFERFFHLFFSFISSFPHFFYIFLAFFFTKKSASQWLCWKKKSTKNYFCLTAHKIIKKKKWWTNKTGGKLHELNLN